MSRLVLVDGYSFLFRAYHSMPPLTNPEGLVVGALYGYSNMLFKIRETLDASHFAVILDHGEKTFRSEIYPEYKANRPPAPDDLIPQFPLVKEVTEAMHIPALDQQGVEADDIIASLSKSASAAGYEVTIISSDKDLMQLIDERVKLYDPMKQKIIDREAVFEKFGVYPEKVLDLLALSGDSADNIPGVPTIGPKTAAELLNNYGDLAGIYQNLENIKQPKRRETLTNNREQAFLSQDLVRLKEDVQLAVGFSDLTLKEIDKEKLAAFFSKHGFKSLLSKIDQDSSFAEATRAEQKQELAQITIKQITKISELADIQQHLTTQPEIFITEHKEQLYLLSDNICYQIILEAAEAEATDLFATTEIIKSVDISQLFAKLLKASSLKKIFYNYKEFYQKYFHFTKEHKLFSSSKNYLNIFDLSVAAYLAGYKKLADLVALPEQQEEAALQNFALKLQAAHLDLLSSLHSKKLLALLYNYDFPFSQLLLHMEEAGFKIAANKLTELSNEFATKIAQAETEIFRLAGEEFNVGSPKQLGEILFEKLKIEPHKKNKKTKSLSTDSEVLEELVVQGYEIAKHILTWRHFSKLKNTYSDVLPKLINQQTGRVHSHFSNITTSTGRLSSNNPNLQNIPIRSKEGDAIRGSFICEPGHKLIIADYSQIELRLLAHIADIKKLQTAFAAGADIHASTASEVFGVALDQVDSELRRKAKTINFGIIYGISGFGLANRLAIERKEASNYIELYFERYPEIKNYMENITELCRKQGYIETILGRKLFFPNINSKNYALRSFTERAVINAPLQGSAADIMKKAMLELDHKITRQNLQARLILQIHDELIYEVKEEEAEKALALIKKSMEQTIKLKVPLEVSADIADSWSK